MLPSSQTCYFLTVYKANLSPLCPSLDLVIWECLKFEQNLFVLGVQGAEEDAVGAIGGSQSFTPPPLTKAKGQDTKEAIPGQLFLGHSSSSPYFVTEFSGKWTLNWTLLHCFYFFQNNGKMQWLTPALTLPTLNGDWMLPDKGCTYTQVPFWSFYWRNRIWFMIYLARIRYYYTNQKQIGVIIMLNGRRNTFISCCKIQRINNFMFPVKSFHTPVCENNCQHSRKIVLNSWNTLKRFIQNKLPSESYHKVLFILTLKNERLLWF